MRPQKVMQSRRDNPSKAATATGLARRGAILAKFRIQVLNIFKDDSVGIGISRKRVHNPSRARLLILVFPFCLSSLRIQEIIGLEYSESHVGVLVCGSPE